jgi:hypothetical protein
MGIFYLKKKLHMDLFILYYKCEEESHLIVAILSAKWICSSIHEPTTIIPAL